jgi:hypothetical protein
MKRKNALFVQAGAALLLAYAGFIASLVIARLLCPG